MTSWRHFQGIFSSIETGVWPKVSLNCLDGPFLRLLTSPRSMTTSCSHVEPSIRIVPKEKWSNRICASCVGGSSALLGGDGGEGGPALLNFLATAVRAENLALFVVD